MEIFLNVVAFLVYWLIGVFIVSYFDRVWEYFTNQHNPTWDPENNGNVVVVTWLALFWPLVIVALVVLGFALVARTILRKSQKQ